MIIENIEIMSRDNAIKASKYIDRPTIIISIHDRNAYPAELDLDNPFITDVLFLAFDDEESVETGGMTSEDAKQILDFIEDYMNDDIDLIVHCGGGVSRSAGTAAAIMFLLFGDDTPVFNNGRFAPNMHCYRSILNAAGFGYNDKDLNEKEERQRELWMELARENGIL